MLVLIVVIGAVNHKLSNDQNLSASAGYTDYEMDQMSLHDGNVLVDSLNVTGVPAPQRSGDGHRPPAVPKRRIRTRRKKAVLRSRNAYRRHHSRSGTWK